MSETEIERMRRIIRLVMIKIGFRCDLSGFGYICCAVELVILNPKLIHCRCKELYELVRQHFELKNVDCVERSIRTSIEDTYAEHGYEIFNTLFGAKLFTLESKPTAGQLIQLLAEFYILRLYTRDPDFDDL